MREKNRGREGERKKIGGGNEGEKRNRGMEGGRDRRKVDRKKERKWERGGEQKKIVGEMNQERKS